MSDRPAPLVPAEVDLRDFAFMPLDVVRLRDSGLTAKASGDEFRAAVLLWCASWHQVPAASLPDDDDELANICGYSRARREWAKVRDGARRGWVLCSDGRLYHDRVAAKALEAWIEKLASAIGGAVGNAKRWSVDIDTHPMRQQFAKAVACLRELDPQSRTLKKKVVAIFTMPSASDSPPDTGGDSPPDSPPDRNRQGQGQRQGLLNTEIESGSSPPSSARGFDGPTPEPSASGLACRAIRAAGIPDVNPGHPGLQRLLEGGVTAADLAATAAELVAKGKPKFLLLLATQEGRMRDAAAAGAVPAAAAPTGPDWTTRRGVEAIAAQHGLPPWDECVPFDAYRAKIRRAVEPAPTQDAA